MVFGVVGAGAGVVAQEFVVGASGVEVDKGAGGVGGGVDVTTIFFLAHGAVPNAVKGAFG